MAETRLYRRRAVRSSGVAAVYGDSGTATARSVKNGWPTGNPAGSSIASRERRGHSTRYTACDGSDGRADGRRLQRRTAAQTACFGRFRMLVGVAPKTTAGWCCPTTAERKRKKKKTATVPENRRADLCSFCPRHGLFCLWCLWPAGGPCFEHCRRLMDQSVNRGVRTGTSR